MAKVYGERFPETSDKEIQTVGTTGGDATLKKELVVSIPLGGIQGSPLPTYPEGTELEQILRDLIAPVIAPKITGLTLVGVSNPYESNSIKSFNQIKINWTQGSGNSTPSYFIFKGTGANSSLIINGTFTGTSYTPTLTIPETIQLNLEGLSAKTQSYSIIGYDSDNNQLGTVSASIEFNYAMYTYTSNLSTLAGNEQAILQGDRFLARGLGESNTNQVTITLDQSTKKYAYVCFPSSWGEASFRTELGTIELSKETITVSINGVDVTYYAYRTPYAYLGTTEAPSITLNIKKI